MRPEHEMLWCRGGEAVKPDRRGELVSGVFAVDYDGNRGTWFVCRETDPSRKPLGRHHESLLAAAAEMRRYVEEGGVRQSPGENELLNAQAVSVNRKTRVPMLSEMGDNDWHDGDNDDGEPYDEGVF
jgi:hypothetical protein